MCLAWPQLEVVDQSAMGTLSCALSVPGVASVGSGLIRAQWVSLSEPGVESVGSGLHSERNGDSVMHSKCAWRGISW